MILIYFVYNSIQSEIQFQKDAEKRISENVQKLKDLRTLQIAYKKAHNSYANDLKDLINFFHNDSMLIVKAEGEVPDSLTENIALELGLISRDTSFTPVRDVVFNKDYRDTRNKSYSLDINTIDIIPSTKKQYNIDAGVIEKGKVHVQVFEISASYGDILNNLNAENKKYDLNKLLKVGSMNEASLNGNWGE